MNLRDVAAGADFRRGSRHFERIILSNEIDCRRGQILLVISAVSIPLRFGIATSSTTTSGLRANAFCLIDPDANDSIRWNLIDRFNMPSLQAKIRRLAGKPTWMV